MTDPADQSDAFGCDRCYRAPAEVAWDMLLSAPRVATLIDESHLIVSLRVCPGCGQRWLQIFTERIDWVGGDDSQSWCVVPVTLPESERLLARCDLAELEPAANHRRHLVVAHRTVGDQSIRWSPGPLIVPAHD